MTVMLYFDTVSVAFTLFYYMGDGSKILRSLIKEVGCGLD
jgi:hypothetical protein